MSCTFTTPTILDSKVTMKILTILIFMQLLSNGMCELPSPRFLIEFAQEHYCHSVNLYASKSDLLNLKGGWLKALIQR